MGKLDVEHFLGVYQMRKWMQENGKTNPPDDIKRLTNEFVEKLSKMPLYEEVTIKGSSFLDSKGNIISTIPYQKNST